MKVRFSDKVLSDIDRAKKVSVQDKLKTRHDIGTFQCTLRKNPFITLTLPDYPRRDAARHAATILNGLEYNFQQIG